MSFRRLCAGVLLSLTLMGCAAGAASRLEDDGGGGGDSASNRILVLIARGEFAQAQVLIHEAVKGGLMSQATATSLLIRIQLLNTKLSEIPVRLQRVSNFPAVLKEHTLHQIITMLEARDYSVATQAQLMMAKKLIEQSPRLMDKVP